MTADWITDDMVERAAQAIADCVAARTGMSLNPTAATEYARDAIAAAFPDGNPAAEYDALLARQDELLTGVANALNGPPPALITWSHHDLPELAAKAVASPGAKSLPDDAAEVTAIQMRLGVIFLPQNFHDWEREVKHTMAQGLLTHWRDSDLNWWRCPR